jgi:hypothetical protein
MDEFLLTNGCSFVWGDELEGCYDDPPTHHEATFTYQLARRMRMGHVNLATCGAGNDKIFRDTISYLSDKSRQQPTHMVILWSALQRQEQCESDADVNFWKNIQSWDNMSQWSQERVLNLGERYWGPACTFNEMYDVRTSIMQQIPKMIAMQDLCKAKGIKLLQGFFHHRCRDNIYEVMTKENRKEYSAYYDRLSFLISQLDKTSRLGIGTHRDLYTVGKDMNDEKPNGHPGEQAHEEYAKLLTHCFMTMFL